MHLDFNGAFESEFRFELQLVYAIKYNLVEKEIGGKIASFTFFIGPVPLSVSPTWTLGFALDILFGGSVTVEFGFKSKHSMDIDVLYDSSKGDSFQVKTKRGSSDGITPIWNFKSAEIYVELRPTFMIGLGCEIGVGIKGVNVVEQELRFEVPLVRVACAAAPAPSRAVHARPPRHHNPRRSWPSSSRCPTAKVSPGAPRTGRTCSASVSTQSSI